MAEAHHVILVVNSRSSDLASLSESVDRITSAGAVLLGIVFNRVPRRRLRKDSYPSSRSARRAAYERHEATGRGGVDAGDADGVEPDDSDWWERPSVSGSMN